MRKVCCFQLPRRTCPDLVEASVATAIFSAECIFGGPRVRLSAAYWIDRATSRCLVDISDEIGEHMAKVLIGCFTRDFGESGFSVRKLSNTVGSPAQNRRSYSGAPPAKAAS